MLAPYLSEVAPLEIYLDAKSVPELRAAAWPRVFSDLRMIGARREEAAEHLGEQTGAVT